MEKKKSLPRKSVALDYRDVAAARHVQRGTKATKNQQKYLEILLNDCGFTTRIQRNAYLTSEAGREIKFLDELMFVEATELIQALVKKRTELNPRGHWFHEEDGDEDLFPGEGL